MAKQKEKLIHCRYPKCKFLHETTELKKEDAIQGGKGRYYYHPDCYHTMQTVNEIRDLFVCKIDPLMTGKQIGMLVSTINNIVFSKHVDVDYLKFVVQYFINNKPGALKYPAGLHYVIQDKDAASAWEREKNRQIDEELRKKQKEYLVKDEFVNIDIPQTQWVNTGNRSKFSRILGV